MSAAVGAGGDCPDAEADDETRGLGEVLLPTDDEPQAGITTAITTATHTTLFMAVRVITLLGPDDRQLFHVGPVWSDLGLDLDPRFQLVRAGHDARHRLGKPVDLALRHLEQQLVMHLQQHAALDM